MNEEELQNPDNWDFEKAEAKPGVKRGRAVVSVAFSRDDFERVAEFAEAFGMKVSEFIRGAALDRAQTTVLFVGAIPATTEAFYSGTFDRVEDVASALSPALRA